ncbi:MAG: hypothetical protein ABIY90_04820 [Puia sp.]
MKKLNASERTWLIIFIVIIIGLMAGCMIETVSDSNTWGPRPVELNKTN